MYCFRNDPAADGVGVAFTDAVGELGRSFDLGATGATQPRSADWARLEADLGVPIATLTQVHGDRVVVVDAETDLAELAGTPADALATRSRRIGLAVRAADCIPVLVADPAAGVIGAAHAGRVGLGAGVLAKLVLAVRDLGGEHLVAWLGPHICGACYEVPADLQAGFAQAHPAAAVRTGVGTPGLDLGAAAEVQLAGLGCEVQRADPCTFTTASLHSYRRDGPAAGRQAGVVWLA